MNEISLNFKGFLPLHTSYMPTESGIYIVYRCRHDPVRNTVDLNQIVYIGESENMYSRISSHEKEKKWKEHLQSNEKIFLAYAPILGGSRLLAEAALIYKHKPPVNDEFKYNFPYAVTRVKSYGQTGLLIGDFTIV